MNSIVYLLNVWFFFHQGTAEWIPLQRAKSGQIQIKCTVTCTGSEVRQSLHVLLLM